MDPKTRFWLKVDTRGPVPPGAPRLGRCWLWTGALFPSKYGQFWLDGKNRRAHRVAYEWEVGPITEATLDHLCCVLNCVRPSHLEPVSVKENVLRGNAPTAINAQKKRCPKGHPYDVVRKKDGARMCSKCIREGGRVRKRVELERRRDEINARRRQRYAARRST